MSKKTEPMFQMLLGTLKNESEAIKAMFFTGKEEDLVRAFQEGKEAYLNNVPVTENPYPEISALDKDGGKYNMNTCWNEGFVISHIENE